jgi:hypothetical protein
VAFVEHDVRPSLCCRGEVGEGRVRDGRVAVVPGVRDVGRVQTSAVEVRTAPSPQILLVTRWSGGVDLSLPLLVAVRADGDRPPGGWPASWSRCRR